MFGIDTSEFLLIGVVALVVIGPKDLPRLMRAAGQWIGKARRLSTHVRAGFDEMIRQAETTATEATPPGRLPTSPVQLATMVLTPDTRSREPGGEKSKVTPLLPGPLAVALAPPPSETAVIAAATVASRSPVVSAEPSSSEESTAEPVAAAPVVVITRDTRAKEPGGAESIVVPLRPGSLAASFAAPLSPMVDLPENAAGADRHGDEATEPATCAANNRGPIAA